VLPPHDPQAAQAHVDECTELAAKLAKRVRDSSIECGICLEKVMSKSEMSQRRFGLMACEHSFCLSCIRNWRQTGQVDTKTVSDGRLLVGIDRPTDSCLHKCTPQPQFVILFEHPACWTPAKGRVFMRSRQMGFSVVTSAQTAAVEALTRLFTLCR
jgi:hypothetical protein